MKLRRSAAMLLSFSIVAVCAVLTISAGSASMAAGDASWGFSLTNLDRTCKPCDDFYQFAMGGWMKANTIPAEYSSWGSFTVLRDKNLAGMRTILESAASSKASPGSNERKIGDFYSSCMDTTAIDAAGSKLLLPISPP
jgi:putative endopeptidase